MTLLSVRWTACRARLSCGAVLLCAASPSAWADDLPPAVAPPAELSVDESQAAADDDAVFQDEAPLDEPPPVADVPAADADPLLDEDLLRELSADGEEAQLGDLGLEPEPDAPPAAGLAGDPLAQLSGQMRTVEERLAAGDAADDTQELQADIVSRLDQLIEEVQRQQSQQQQSQGQQTGQRQNVEQPEGQPNAGQTPLDQPASESTERLVEREVEPPDPAALDALIKDVWGDLPLRVRQQLMQSYRERYLPKYELEIIEYFRTLVDRPQQP